MKRQSNRSSDDWAVVMGLLAVVALAGVIWVVLRNNPPSSNPDQASAAPLTTPPPSPSAIGTDTAATATPMSPALTSTAVSSLKRTQQATFVAELTSSPFPTAEPGPTGIRDDEYARLQWAANGLIVENSFGGLVDGNPVSIFAGAHASDPDQGIVQVVWVFSYRTFQERFLTPGKHGSIHIVDEENNRLTLVSADATTFYFDIPGLAFASSPSDIVPTITPIPSYTPPVPPTTVAPPTAYHLPSTATPPPPP